MFLFRKKEMDIAAAKQFWKWFVENEQWIIDNVSSNGVEVVWAIDAQIKPVFPYFKKSILYNIFTGFPIIYVSVGKDTQRGEKLKKKSTECSFVIFNSNFPK